MNSTTPAYVLDHVGLAVGDLVASRDFYEQALAPLGFAPVVELDDPPVIAFGLATMPQFWIHQGRAHGKNAATRGFRYCKPM